MLDSQLLFHYSFKSVHRHPDLLHNLLLSNCVLTCRLIPKFMQDYRSLFNRVKLFCSLLALLKCKRFVGHMEMAKAYFLNNVILLLSSYFSLFAIRLTFSTHVKLRQRLRGNIQHRSNSAITPAESWTSW